jgi:hypothetical protein
MKESFIKAPGVDGSAQLSRSAAARRATERAIAQKTLAVLEDVKVNPNRYKNKANVWINKTTLAIADPVQEDQRNLYKISIEKLRSTCSEMFHSQLRQNEIDLIAAAGEDN